MRKVLSLAALVTFLAGCGGGSANNNPFAGSWTGTFTDATAATTGTLSLVISNNGTVSGTGDNTTGGTSGAVTGHVNSGGYLTASIAYSTVTTEQGYIVFGPQGQLQGNLTETQSGTVVGTAVISLTKQ